MSPGSFWSSPKFYNMQVRMITMYAEQCISKCSLQMFQTAYTNACIWLLLLTSGMIRYSAMRSTQAKFNLKLHAILLHTSLDARKHWNLLAAAGASVGLSEERNLRTELWLAKINLKMMPTHGLCSKKIEMSRCLTREHSNWNRTSEVTDF